MSFRGLWQPYNSAWKNYSSRKNSKEQKKLMKSYRSDEERNTLVNKIKVVSARQLKPADLHRAAVRDVADLTHMSGRSLNQSVTVMHDGVFRVRCSQKQIEQMDLSRLMSTSRSGPRRALGRYASSMSAGYATDPSAPRVRGDG